MNGKKNLCNNYNHGKMNPTVSFCPTCGDKFNNQPSLKRSCDEQKHKLDRKNRNIYCTDCGKSLSSM